MPYKKNARREGPIRRNDESQQNKVKFVRAAYGRSCAVTEGGSVFIWGQGMRNERQLQVKHIFTDP